MGVLQPNSMGQLRSMIYQVGGGASRLAGMPTPGTNDIRSTFNALQSGPSTVLPGGGVLGGSSPLAQFERTEEPAATLPLYQGEASRKMGLAGIESGAGEAQTQADTLNLTSRQAIQNQLQQLLFGLGFSPATQATAGGGFGLLARLLGI